MPFASPPKLMLLIFWSNRLEDPLCFPLCELQSSNCFFSFIWMLYLFLLASYFYGLPVQHLFKMFRPKLHIMLYFQAWKNHWHHNIFCQKHIKRLYHYYIIAIECHFFSLTGTAQFCVLLPKTYGYVQTYWRLTNFRVSNHARLRTIIQTIILSLDCWHDIAFFM